MSPTKRSTTNSKRTRREFDIIQQVPKDTAQEDQQTNKEPKNALINPREAEETDDKYGSWTNRRQLELLRGYLRIFPEGKKHGQVGPAWNELRDHVNSFGDEKDLSTDSIKRKVEKLLAFYRGSDKERKTAVLSGMGTKYNPELQAAAQACIEMKDSRNTQVAIREKKKVEKQEQKADIDAYVLSLTEHDNSKRRRTEPAVVEVNDVDSPGYHSPVYLGEGEFTVETPPPSFNDDNSGFGSSEWRNLTKTSISLLREILDTNKKLLDTNNKLLDQFVEFDVFASSLLINISRSGL